MIAPTKIYVKALRGIKDAGVRIKACSHITGGGFYENIPRMLPEGKCAVVEKDSYEIPAIFKMLAREGEIAEQMMYNTYNMGLGMILAVDPADVDKTMEAVKAKRRDSVCRRKKSRTEKRSYFMLKIAVLVSGGGTNLQAIIDKIAEGVITNTEIAVVISNNKNAYALERAKQAGIEAVCVSPKDYETVSSSIRNF